MCAKRPNKISCSKPTCAPYNSSLAAQNPDTYERTRTSLHTTHDMHNIHNTQAHTHTPTHIVRITVVVIIIVIVVHPSAISSPRISCPADIDDFRVGPARILKHARHSRRRPARPGPYLGPTCPPNLWARPLRPPNSSACRCTNGMRVHSGPLCDYDTYWFVNSELSGSCRRAHKGEGIHFQACR